MHVAIDAGKYGYFNNQLCMGDIHEFCLFGMRISHTTNHAHID